MDALDVGVTLHDQAGRLLHANPRAQEVLALHPLDVDERQQCRTGRGQLLVTRGGHGLRYDELPFRAIFRDPARREAVVGLWTAGGTGPRWLRALCFREEGGDGLEETAVTLWLDAGASGSEDEAERGAIAAHELRTPLTALQLTLHTVTERMGREAGAGHWIADKLALARGQCRRMSRLIDRLLDPSHENGYDGPLELERTDVAELVREVALQQAEKLLRAGCELQLVLSPAPALVDRVRLEEVVENLLANACKYARGGRVEVRVELVGEAVRLVVRDDGPGIPEAEHEAVFSRYVRATTALGPGLGLGLYLVRRIAEAHGGAARITGGLGRGTQFVVELPRSPPPRRSA